MLSFDKTALTLFLVIKRKNLISKSYETKLSTHYDKNINFNRLIYLKNKVPST